MPKTELRCSIEVREDAEMQSPGRLVGTLLTYGQQAHDRAEVFAPGSLSWPADGVVLTRQHQRGQPITRVVPEVRGDQVVVDQPLPDTQAGRDAAREIRGGLFRGLSVEFRAVLQDYQGGVRRIRRAVLRGAGLVDSPSYQGSRVEVRSRAGIGRRRWQ